MFGGFFGDFLVKEGVITPEHLDLAISAQRQHNVLLGFIAKNRGWLDDSSLSRLLAEQAEQHAKLGTIAVEEGLLTAAQVDELLAEQARNHLFLGDALVRIGVLDSKELERYLQMFRAEIKKASESMSAHIEKLAGHELVNVVLEAYRSFFFRLGYVVKINMITTEVYERAPDSILFLSSFRFKHGKTVYMGPALTLKTVTFLFSGRGLVEDVAYETKREAIEYLEQLFYGLNYQSCRGTPHTEEHAHVGAIHTNAPDRRPATVFTFIGLAEPFQIVYFD